MQYSALRMRLGAEGIDTEGTLKLGLQDNPAQGYERKHRGLTGSLYALESGGQLQPEGCVGYTEGDLE